MKNSPVKLISAEALLAWGVMLLAFAAPWAQGCQFRYGWAGLAAGSAALLLLGVLARVHLPSEPRIMRWVWWGLLGLHAIQLIPLPPVFIYAFAPLKATFVNEALSAGTWMPLSANVEATRNNFLVLGACYIAFRLGLGVFSHRHRIEHLGWALLASAFLISLYGFSELSADAGAEMHPGRLRGTYTNPNRFAGFLELALPLGGLCAWLRWRAMRETNPQEKLSFEKTMQRRLLVICGLALWLTAFFALIQTYSRMGFVGFVFGAIVATFLLYRREKGAGVALGIGAVLALAAATGLTFGMDYLFKRYTDTLGNLEVAEGRLQIWSGAIPLFKEHWLLGGGSGAFRSLFKHYQPAELQNYAKFAENDYLNAACDLGLLGFCLLLTGLIYFLYRVSTSGVHERRPHLLGLSWSIAAIAIHSFTDFNLQEPANAWLFALLMGAAFGLIRQTDTRSAAASARRLHPVAGAVWTLTQTALAAWLLWTAGQVLQIETYWPEPGSALRPNKIAGGVDKQGSSADWVMDTDPFYSAPLLKQSESLIQSATQSNEVDFRNSCWSQAETELKAALELDPLNHLARFMLAKIYLARENAFKEARHQMALAYLAAPSYPDIAILAFQMEIHGWRKDGRPGGVPPQTMLDMAARALNANPMQLRPVLTLLILASPYDPRWDSVVPEESAVRLEYARWLSGQGLRSPSVRILDGVPALLDKELAREPDLEKRAMLRNQRETDAALVYLKAGQSRKFEELVKRVIERQPPAKQSEIAAQMVRREWERWPGIPSFSASFLRSEYEREPWAQELSGDDAMVRSAYREAEAAFARANELQASPERYLKLAQSLQAQRKTLEAILALETAATLGARDSALRLEVAEWMYRCGNTALALKELSKIEAEFPERALICAEKRKLWSR